MVTFNCEVCNDTVPKKNTEKHYYRCPQAYYTCIDCSKTFDDGVSYKNHTSCISEDEKYQKALYKGKKKPKEPAAASAAPAKKVETPVAKKAEKPAANKVEKPKKASNGIELNKGESLYKILKTVKDKDAKKAFLKSLVVGSNGEIKYAKE